MVSIEIIFWLSLSLVLINLLKQLHAKIGLVLVMPALAS